MKRALVCGAGGFIASHLVRRLKQEGHWVRGADIKLPEFGPIAADDFRVLDLRQTRVRAYKTTNLLYLGRSRGRPGGSSSQPC